MRLPNSDSPSKMFAPRALIRTRSNCAGGSKLRRARTSSVSSLWWFHSRQQTLPCHKTVTQRFAKSPKTLASLEAQKRCVGPAAIHHGAHHDCAACLVDRDWRRLAFENLSPGVACSTARQTEEVFRRRAVQAALYDRLTMDCAYHLRGCVLIRANPC